MSDRRAELEAKKAKLEQLRKLKEQRRQEKEFRDRTVTHDIGLGLSNVNSKGLSSSSLKTPSGVSGDSISSSDLNSSMVSNSDLDDLLKGVGLFPVSSAGKFQSKCFFCFPQLILPFSLLYSLKQNLSRFNLSFRYNTIIQSCQSNVSRFWN